MKFVVDRSHRNSGDGVFPEIPDQIEVIKKPDTKYNDEILQATFARNIIDSPYITSHDTPSDLCGPNGLCGIPVPTQDVRNARSDTNVCNYEQTLVQTYETAYHVLQGKDQKLHLLLYSVDF